MLLSCGRRGLRFLVITGSFFVILGATTAAQAQTPKGRVSITGQVGGCIPAFGDINRDIRLGNDVLRRYEWSTLNQLGVGFTFTADLRARVYGPFTLSVGMGQSFARTGIDFDEVISIKPKVDFYHVRAFYDLPFKPKPRMFFRIGAGPVFARSAQVAIRDERRQVDGGTVWVENATIKATGTGAHVLFENEMMLNQKTTLVLDVGYRALSLGRSSNASDFRDWSRSDVESPQLDLDGDGIPNVLDLADSRNNEEGNTQKGYLSGSFLDVPLGPDGKPIDIGGGRPQVRIRDLQKIDFSGPQASVGLRFYIF